MPKPVRPIRVDGNVAYVPLTQGYEATIDIEDVALVDGFNWFAMPERRKDRSIKTVYAVRSDYAEGSIRRVFMHRVIAGTPDGMKTDHEDCNGLNNRRKNLRQATIAQNAHNTLAPITNTSGAKGVSKSRGRWQAQIWVGGQNRHLGRFDTKDAAAAAYAKASAELHQEYGRTA